MSTDSDPTSADRLAIQELAYRYASGVDRRDHGLFLSAFCVDATLTVFRNGPDGTQRKHTHTGHDQLRLIPDVITRYAKTFHFVGNHRCDIVGDTAVGEVYCVARHLRTEREGQTDFVMLIRYQDTYRRDLGGSWLIAERTVLVDWTEEHAV